MLLNSFWIDKSYNLTTSFEVVFVLRYEPRYNKNGHHNPYRVHKRNPFSFSAKIKLIFGIVKFKQHLLQQGQWLTDVFAF